jgi:hypothetical protein
MLLPSETTEIWDMLEELPILWARQTHEEDPFGQPALCLRQIFKD